MRIALIFLPFVIIVSAMTTHSHAEMLWLEAEQFNRAGGWTNDAQFIDQMGSPYLMAIGLGTPVADAGTTVQVPQAGRYRLWVRTKDWAPEHHPGKFHILLNGKSAGATFGASGKADWLWEDGGIHELDGQVELRLHDLTGVRSAHHDVMPDPATVVDGQGPVDGGNAAVGRVDLVAARSQAAGDHLADVRFVVHDEDSGHRRSPVVQVARL